MCSHRSDGGSGSSDPPGGDRARRRWAVKRTPERRLISKVRMATQPARSGPGTIGSCGIVRVLAAVVVLALALGHSPAAQEERGVTAPLRELEAALRLGSPDALIPLLSEDFDPAT